MPTLGYSAATQFANVQSDLLKAGTPIGKVDAMMAGHALAVGAVFVTNNARHVGRVAGLNVKNWTHSP